MPQEICERTPDTPAAQPSIRQIQAFKILCFTVGKARILQKLTDSALTSRQNLKNNLCIREFLRRKVPYCRHFEGLLKRTPQEKSRKIIKNGMNQVQVWQFGLILRQEGATASRKPLECLRASLTAKKPKKCQKWAPWAPHGGGPHGAHRPPPWRWRCGAAPPVQFTLVCWLHQHCSRMSPPDARSWASQHSTSN